MSKLIEASNGTGTLLALEPRIMFDGAALATGAEVIQDTTTQDQTVIPDIAGETSSDSAITDTPDDALWSSGLSVPSPSDRKEIVFIDTNVEDYHTLMEGIDPNADVILLDSTRDGIEQIAEILRDRSDIDAIHIVSHGNQGELYLGTGTLSMASMQGEYMDELATIKQALMDEADFLIYGCNFGEGGLGKDAATLLAELTGADIAASTDDTGSAELGGDWDLEYTTGEIDTAVAVSAEGQLAWEGLLATETLLDNFDSVSFSNNDGTQSWTGNWQELGGESDGAGGGDIQVDNTIGLSTNALRIDTDVLSEGASRAADLSGASTATLNFDYMREAGGEIVLEVYDGSTWNLVNTFVLNTTDVSAQNYSTDISAYIDTNTQVRFVVSVADSNGRLYVDNFQISYDTNQVPVIANLGGDTLAYTEGDGAVVIDQSGDAAVTDADSTDFDTSTLTVSFQAGSDSAEDVLAIQNQGTGAGQIGVSGSNVTYQGVTIGTFTGGTGGTDLVITLNASADATAVSALVNNITYENTDTNDPTTGSRTVRYVLTDGDGGTSANYDTTVTVTSVNDVSVGVNDSVNIPEDTPLVFNPTANDTDAESDAISVVEFTQPSNGTVVDNGDGTLTYTPDSNYTGADSFDYVAIDAGSGLQHYWGLDGEAVDAIGSADGTLNGTATVAGDFGDGLSFNETTDYVLLPDVIYASEFTISFDFKIDDNTGALFQYLYSHGDINTTDSVNIFLNEASHSTDPNMLRTVVRDSNDTLSNFALEIDLTSIIGDSQWHTYTLTAGANGLEVFVDGVSLASDATRGKDGVNPTGGLYLGARQDLAADRFYGGSLDSVQIYDNALDSSHVTDLV